MSLEEKQKILQKQGTAIFGVDMKIVSDDGEELPWDGEAFGDLLVRGHWVVDSYYGGEGAKASDRHSYDDTEPDEPRRHRQTSGLMRHSLSLAVGEAHSQHGAGQSSSQSPVKRPENLE